MKVAWIPAMNDQYFLAQAFTLARRGIYTTDPNPRVGCVIVRDGQIIGEGFHQSAGHGRLGLYH